MICTWEKRSMQEGEGVYRSVITNKVARGWVVTSRWVGGTGSNRAVF